MKRTFAIVLILLTSIFILKQNCKAYSIVVPLNNKTLSSDIAIKSDDIVMISYLDTVYGRTNPNAFIPVEKNYSDIMEKKEYPDGLWYGLCTRNRNDTTCYSLISFLKSSMVN